MPVENEEFIGEEMLYQSERVEDERPIEYESREVANDNETFSDEEEVSVERANIEPTLQFVIDQKGGGPEDWSKEGGSGGFRFDGTHVRDAEGNAWMGLDEEMSTQWREGGDETYRLPDYVEQTENGEKWYVTVMHLDRETGEVSYSIYAHEITYPKEAESLMKEEDTPSTESYATAWDESFEYAPDNDNAEPPAVSEVFAVHMEEFQSEHEKTVGQSDSFNTETRVSAIDTTHRQTAGTSEYAPVEMQREFERVLDENRTETVSERESEHTSEPLNFVREEIILQTNVQQPEIIQEVRVVAEPERKSIVDIETNAEPWLSDFLKDDPLPTFEESPKTEVILTRPVETGSPIEKEVKLSAPMVKEGHESPIETISSEPTSSAVTQHVEDAHEVVPEPSIQESGADAREEPIVPVLATDIERVVQDELHRISEHVREDVANLPPGETAVDSKVATVVEHTKEIPRSVRTISGIRLNIQRSEPRPHVRRVEPLHAGGTPEQSKTSKADVMELTTQPREMLLRAIGVPRGRTARGIDMIRAPYANRAASRSHFPSDEDVEDASPSPQAPLRQLDSVRLTADV